MATFIFDFDDTIFDTKKLKIHIFEKLSNFDMDKIIIEKTYKETLLENNGNYILKKHLENLFHDKENFTEITANFLSWFYNLDFKKYILPKIEETLNILNKEHYLILLTKGDEDFQNIKIKGSGLDKYFKEINIVNGKKEEFLTNIKYSEIIFINDKESENEIIKNKFPNIKIINPNQKGDISAPLMDC